MSDLLAVMTPGQLAGDDCIYCGLSIMAAGFFGTYVVADEQGQAVVAMLWGCSPTCESGARIRGPVPAPGGAS